MSEHRALPSRLAWPVDRATLFVVHDLVVTARYAGRRPKQTIMDRLWAVRGILRRITRALCRQHHR